MRFNSLSLIDTFNIEDTEYKYDDENTGTLLDYLASGTTTDGNNVTIRLNVPTRESFFSFLNLDRESRSIYRVDDEIAELLRGLETILGQDRSTLVKRIPAPVKSNYINVIIGRSGLIDSVPITVSRNDRGWRVVPSENNIDQQIVEAEVEEVEVEAEATVGTEGVAPPSHEMDSIKSEECHTELRPLRRDIPYGRRLNARD